MGGPYLKNKSMKSNTQNKIKAALLGVAVGDAVGVPYEFKSRKEMDQNPATEMTGYGTYNLPPGTWSDDSSLTFCLAESLVNGYNLADMAQKFVDWKFKNYWTPLGDVFDIGNTSAIAINRLQNILATQPENLALEQHLGEESENGNGSLMRIMPLLFHLKGQSIDKQFACIWEVSALTHRHIRAAMSCLIYLKLAEHLLNGLSKEEAYQTTKNDILAFWEMMQFADRERAHFKNILALDIRHFNRDQIESSGYVIHSLEASLWCFLRTDDFKTAILQAVNLGSDTDTTAAITGGLAGIYYGETGIPSHWISALARLEDINSLCQQLQL